jgi:hypothetical protein
VRYPRFSSICATLVLALLLSPAPGVAAAAQSGAAQQPEPEVQDVYIVMRDMGLAYEDVSIRTIVPNEEGVSALVGLTGGTLVDVVMTPSAMGWTLRDIYYVAGNAEEFQNWSGPWRRRVAEAERFLAAASGDEEGRRRAEELAPLVWFEDLDESQRLWGLNPTTYRIMQTLKMMPNLSGPMGGGGR